MKPLATTVREYVAHSDKLGRVDVILGSERGQKTFRKRAVKPGSVRARIVVPGGIGESRIYELDTHVDSYPVGNTFEPSLALGIIGGSVNYDTGEFHLMTTYHDHQVRIAYLSPRDDPYKGAAPKKVHKLHSLMAELNDCAPKPKPRVPTRKFSFEA